MEFVAYGIDHTGVYIHIGAHPYDPRMTRVNVAWGNLRMHPLSFIYNN